MHKYDVGQRVQLIASPLLARPETGYEIVRQLPESDGELCYRIKSLGEGHDRVVKESQLQRL